VPPFPAEGASSRSIRPEKAHAVGRAGMEPLHLQGLLRLFNLVFSASRGLPGAAGLTGRGGPHGEQASGEGREQGVHGSPSRGADRGSNTCARRHTRGLRQQAPLEMNVRWQAVGVKT
jgi:hypothetical protein